MDPRPLIGLMESNVSLLVPCDTLERSRSHSGVIEDWRTSFSVYKETPPVIKQITILIFIHSKQHPFNQTRGIYFSSLVPISSLKWHFSQLLLFNFGLYSEKSLSSEKSLFLSFCSYPFFIDISKSKDWVPRNYFSEIFFLEREFCWEFVE